MAKKTTKKPAKSKKPAAKKSAKKPAAKKSGGAGGMPKGMRAVNTGKGASPAEIGADLVALFNSGRPDLFEQKYWSKDIVSCEGVGVGLQWEGRKAVEAKNADWMSKHTLLGGSAEGPYTGSSGFAIKFRMQVKVNETGQEMNMEEIGVYTVKDGKVIREEFMYGKM